MAKWFNAAIIFHASVFLLSAWALACTDFLAFAVPFTGSGLFFLLFLSARLGALGDYQ